MAVGVDIVASNFMENSAKIFAKIAPKKTCHSGINANAETIKPNWQINV
jgi:hypothetical protein